MVYRADDAFAGFNVDDWKALVDNEATKSVLGTAGVTVAGELSAESAKRILQGRDQYFGEMAAVQVMDVAPSEIWSASHSTPELVNLEALTWKASELSSQDALTILNERDRYLN